jgi:hypothetical protein
MAIMTPQTNIKGLFGKWLNGIDKRNKGTDSSRSLGYSLEILELSK